MDILNKNKKKYGVTSFLLCIVLSLMAFSNIVFAEDQPIPKTNTEKQQEVLSRLKSEFNLTKNDYVQSLSNTYDAKKRLELVGEEKTTLQQQLANIDDLMVVTKNKLIDALKQVVENENEIVLLYQQMELKQVALDYQKQLLKDYITVIYKEENAYLLIDESGNINAFKLLLADGTVGENLRDIQYFDLLNETGQQMVEKLNALNEELKAQEKDLQAKKLELVDAQKKLEEEKRQLDYQKAAKENLLSLTLGQEKIYGQLIKQTEKQEQDTLNDLKNLNDALSFMQQKIAEEGDKFDPDQYSSILNSTVRAVYNFESDNAGVGSTGFSWPVTPNKGISAYFHDSSYYARFGVQHNAIDIPEYQGSPIHSPADGVVYKVKDNGYGYSYIILAHAGGFTTTYGHVSSILVEEGQRVSQGSIIGLTGGMPGTKGSGYMTTGPHLHFEIYLNGTHIDPLNYLPLSAFSPEFLKELPEKYLKKEK